MQLNIKKVKKRINLWKEKLNFIKNTMIQTNFKKLKISINGPKQKMKLNIITMPYK